jgi:cytochrome oxidase Cu insertion factor (SCO1/SenC/PrrC family)
MMEQISKKAEEIKVYTIGVNPDNTSKTKYNKYFGERRKDEKKITYWNYDMKKLEESDDDITASENIALKAIGRDTFLNCLKVKKVYRDNKIIFKPDIKTEKKRLNGSLHYNNINKETEINVSGEPNKYNKVYKVEPNVWVGNYKEYIAKKILENSSKKDITML